jgi:hypothetical protein
LRTQKVVWEKLQKKLMMFVDVDSTKIVSGGYDNNVHVWYLNHFHGTDSKKKGIFKHKNCCGLIQMPLKNLYVLHVWMNIDL